MGELGKALDKIKGSAEEKFKKLKGKYKKLNCLWNTWDKENFLHEESAFKSSLSENDRRLIERHSISAYGCFFDSAKRWTGFNEEVLKLRKGQKIIRGGLQMASDTMIQGDLYVIPLTSAIGYQANSFVIVHFSDASPDMGRKVFQPELKELAEKISVRAVNIFKKYLQHLRPDPGVITIAPDKELHDWKKFQENYRDENGLNIESVSIISEPQQEQDVVALFHQLLGCSIIGGYEFFATSQSDRYDSLFNLNYPIAEEFVFEEENRPLGVSLDLPFPYQSPPSILEFKYDFDALIRDFDKDEKFPQHIGLVVCWDANKHYKEKYFLESLLIDDQGQERVHFGATHRAIPEGASKPDFEVIILRDLISYLSNPEDEIAKQKTKYED